jgi:hypothetical protein
MATYDFATVEVYTDEHRVEAYVPFEQQDAGRFLKTRFDARFKADGSKKRWVVELKFSKSDAASIVSGLEEELYRIAFEGWRDIVKTFSQYACASRRFDVKFAAGGIRIMLPGGHPLHYRLGQMSGMKPDRDVWKIPASRIKPKELADMLKRIAKEDREVFTEATEPYRDRTITGQLLLPWSEARGYGLGDDGIVMADYSFVKVADPQVVPMQIHAWPFRVVSTSPGDGAIAATLAYMEPDAGARSVGALMATPRETRRPLLDEVHAAGKWKTKSAW